MTALSLNFLLEPTVSTASTSAAVIVSAHSAANVAAAALIFAIVLVVDTAVAVSHEPP